MKSEMGSFSYLKMHSSHLRILAQKMKMHIYVISPPNLNVSEVALTPNKMFQVVYLKASIFSKLKC